MTSFFEMLSRGETSYKQIAGTSVFVRHTSPLLPVRYYVREIGSYLLTMHVETKIESRHVAALLSCISEQDAAGCVESPAGYVSLPTSLAEFPAITQTVLLSPTLARYPIIGAPKEDLLRTIWVVPIQKTEICHDERGDELVTRLNCSLIPYPDPEREPFPALAMQYKHVYPRPEVSGGGRKMGIWPWKAVQAHVEQLQTGGGSVQVENWERHFIRVTWDRAYVVAWGKVLRRLTVEEMKVWLRAYAFTGIAAAWEAIGVTLPVGTSTAPATVAPLEQAIRTMCTSTSGTPTPSAVKELYDALRGDNLLAVACLKTASLCAADPELTREGAARMLARLAAPKMKGEPASEPVSRRDRAEACVRVALECVASPSARKFDEIIRAYQRARYRGELDPERLEDFWNAWLEDVVLSASRSSVAEEIAWLQEALSSTFVPEGELWLEGTCDENDQFFVEAMTAKGRSMGELAVAGIQIEERTARVSIRSRNGKPLGRARAVHYVRHILLRTFLHESDRDDYDVLEVIEGDQVWRV